MPPDQRATELQRRFKEIVKLFDAQAEHSRKLQAEIDKLTKRIAELTKKAPQHH
jgi:septal ring factor EnvC (AmiA/AmiB activator)